MQVRDDEELAVDQIPAAGREDDPALVPTARQAERFRRRSLPSKHGQTSPPPL